MSEEKLPVITITPHGLIFIFLTEEELTQYPTHFRLSDEDAVNLDWFLDILARKTIGFKK